MPTSPEPPQDPLQEPAPERSAAQQPHAPEPSGARASGAAQGDDEDGAVENGETDVEAAGGAELVPGLDPELLDQLPAFELFFKTFGFKRVHGRVWGLLVLSELPLSSKEVSQALSISTGLTSTTINELVEWGALRSIFDPERRCHLHTPVGNTMSIVATILRRREQVAMAHFKRSANQTLEYIKRKYGPADPRVLTLRSIIGSCEIAEAVMQLVMTSVERALGDSQSLLSKALTTALKLSSSLPGFKRGKRDAELPRAIEEFIESEKELAKEGKAS